MFSRCGDRCAARQGRTGPAEMPPPFKTRVGAMRDWHTNSCAILGGRVVHVFVWNRGSVGSSVTPIAVGSNAASALWACQFPAVTPVLSQSHAVRLPGACKPAVIEHAITPSMAWHPTRMPPPFAICTRLQNCDPNQEKQLEDVGFWESAECYEI